MAMKGERSPVKIVIKMWKNRELRSFKKTYWKVPKEGIPFDMPVPRENSVTAMAHVNMSHQGILIRAPMHRC
eukprot:scaffold306_cov67-Cylindrotheca_fusiformis.AAC.5